MYILNKNEWIYKAQDVDLVEFYYSKITILIGTKMYIEEYLYTKKNQVIQSCTKKNYTKIYKIYNFYVHLDT